ncbi:MAG: methyltransferase domain-containing protein [Alphaproteobacteria bacterium]|nr:methyltransferase domain-containing protein [Alphaproteobacteria bacterium]
MTQLGAEHSSRKATIISWMDQVAGARDSWLRRNDYFHQEHQRYMQFLIPKNARVLDLGCGTGQLLASLEPSYGVGLDFSAKMIDVARENFPNFTFEMGDAEDLESLAHIEGPFDVIVLSDTIGYFDDCETTLRNLHRLCSPDTRIVIAYYSRYWEPLLRMAELFGLKMRQPSLNWLSTGDIGNLLHLADFDIIKRDWRQLVPRRLLGLGPLVNRFLGTLPGLRRFSLRNYLVARPMPEASSEPLSVTVLIPCRNERGNIEPAIQRMPRFADDMEILFVEGNSSDGTFEECERVRDAYAGQWDIKAARQDGKGKGDAVRKGFDLARGDVLMILDSDLTMPPEDLPKFYAALRSGKGEFINGSRLVYPMEREAMRFLNWVANQIFSVLFSWLLNQRFTDTLCGTKVLRKRHYEKIAENRAYFGDFDPFGDFDLIFGATKLNLKVSEVPIRYASRTYGETQISRFSHGWLLVRMVVFAFFRLKAF